MKSMQTYLMKPQQLRKKLQNPKFRSTFLQWSKSNVSLNSNSIKNDKQPRSKSPIQNYQKSLNLYHSSKPKHVSSTHNNKQNIKPSTTSNTSLTKNNIKLKVTSKDNIKSTHSLSLQQNQQNNNHSSVNKQPNRNSPSTVFHQLKKRAISQHYNHNKNYQSSKLLSDKNGGSSNNNPHQNNTNKQLSSKNRYNSCSSILQRGPQSGGHNNKKKQRSTSSVDNHHNEQMAANNNQSSKHEQPKRQKQTATKNIQIKYAYRTKQGVQITNPNKTNQDSLLIKTNLFSNCSSGNLLGVKDSMMFAVADGHGMYGHVVSQYLVKNLSKNIEQEMIKGKSKTIIEAIPAAYNKLQQGLEYSPQNSKKQQQEQENHSQKQKTHQQQKVNASCSGSTLINVIIVQKQQIICSNVGDSRAILARQIDKKNWEMIYLSQDHKPTIQAQKKRILKSGGKIHAFRDENGYPIGPQRVWLPNQNMQGLAMSRSFGDNVSKAIGVTHVPEIIKLKIDKRDKFVLLASDGIWQFISNQQVLQLIVPYYRQNKLQQACDALLKLAYQRWTVQDKSIVDDITLILVFFNWTSNKQ